MEYLNNKKLLLGLMMTAFLTGCGVKGLPVAPINPAPMGRGQPTYKEKQKKKTDPNSPTAGNSTAPSEPDEK